MTRTARAAYPRAVNKDRSESRSGLDSSMRKSGAGHHNWGSLADERQLEFDALDDEQLLEGPSETLSDDASVTSGTSAVKTEQAVSEEEIQKARQFRKDAFKKQGELDLSAIARTSAAVSSSPPRDGLKSPKVSDAISPL